MNPEETTAYIQAETACALAEIAGMQAENALRAMKGEAPAYVYEHFMEIINRYQISHNAVIGMYQNAWRG